MAREGRVAGTERTRRGPRRGPSGGGGGCSGRGRLDPRAAEPSLHRLLYLHRLRFAISFLRQCSVFFRLHLHFHPTHWRSRHGVQQTFFNNRRRRVGVCQRGGREGIHGAGEFARLARDSPCLTRTDHHLQRDRRSRAESACARFLVDAKRGEGPQIQGGCGFSRQITA